MKLAFHQLRYDLRSFRWLVAMWLALLGLQLTIQCMDFVPNSSPGMPSDLTITSFLPCLVFIGLVAAVVLADSPSRHDKFLATRPMPPRSLWMGKALFILLIMVVPSVLQEGLHLLLKGWTAGLVAHGMLERLVIVALSAVIVAAFASLWRNIKQFVLGAAGVGLGLLTAAILLTLFKVNEAVEPNMAKLASLVFNAALISGVAAASYCYRWKTWARGLAATVVLTGVTVGANFWPWDLLTAKPGDAALARAMSLESVQVPLFKFPVVVSEDKREFNASVAPQIESLPPDCYVEWQCQRAALSWSSGMSLAMTPPRTPSLFSINYSLQQNPAEYSRQLSMSLGGNKLVFIGNPNTILTCKSELTRLGSASLLGKEALFSQPAIVQADLTGHIYRWEKALVLPLVDGVAGMEGPNHWKIAEAWVGSQWKGQVHDEISQESVSIRLQCDHVKFEVSDDLATVANNWPKDRYEFVLYRQDRTVTQFVEPEFWKISRGFGSACTRDLLMLTFRPDYCFRPMVESNSVAGLSLVIFRKTYVGSIQKHCESPMLKLADCLVQPKSAEQKSENQISNVEFSQRLAALSQPIPNAPRLEVGRYLYDVICLLEARKDHDFGNTAVEAQLARYVPEHLALFIDGLEPGIGPYGRRALSEAIRQGAVKDQEGEIIEALVRVPDLIKVVEQRGWIEDARPLFNQIFAKHRPLPWDLARVVAGFQDRSTYLALLGTLEDWPSIELYETVRVLPGIGPDLDRVMQRIWEQWKTFANAGEAYAALATAMRHGNREAFEQAYGIFQQLRPDQRWNEWLLIRALFANFGGLSNMDEREFPGFLEQHKPEDFQFDPMSRRFVLQAKGI